MEHSRRAIAHACYYGVYTFDGEIFQLGQSNRSEAGHADIKDLLRGLKFSPTVPPPHVVAARTYFVELRRIRLHADYHLDRPFTANHADRALQIAENVFSRVASQSQKGGS